MIFFIEVFPFKLFPIPKISSNMKGLLLLRRLFLDVITGCSSGFLFKLFMFDFTCIPVFEMILHSTKSGSSDIRIQGLRLFLLSCEGKNWSWMKGINIFTTFQYCLDVK